MRTTAHVCGHCGKAFVTDNAWSVCKEDADFTVEARFCRKACRTAYCVGKGWTYDGLNRLCPPVPQRGTK